MLSPGLAGPGDGQAQGSVHEGQGKVRACANGKGQVFVQKNAPLQIGGMPLGYNMRSRNK